MVPQRVAERLADELGINLAVLPLEEWRSGIDIELEHDPRGDFPVISYNDYEGASRIAAAHFRELGPRYYILLRKMEAKEKEFWKGKKMPPIFL